MRNFTITGKRAGALLLGTLTWGAWCVSAQEPVSTKDIVEAKSIVVPWVDWGEVPAIELVDKMMEGSEGLELHALDRVNWPDAFPARPEVSFRIAHSGEEIYLKFYVHEPEIRATFTADNGQPWKDSCVEFFVMPDPDEPRSLYYNLELNCIGYGVFHASHTEQRYVLLEEPVTMVRRLASLGGEGFETREGDFHWTLTLAIPTRAFTLSEQPFDLCGKTLRGNFYKCGDGLPTPHYLSWSPIPTSRPGFHRPEFFGTLIFGTSIESE